MFDKFSSSEQFVFEIMKWIGCEGSDWDKIPGISKKK